jgi:catechol 2,3-dioxygenase-like lactoylglutathione lyase family enzyme
MIGYVTLGSNDLERARAFYSALLAEIGGREVMRLDNGLTMYGTGRGQPAICITTPYNGKAAVAGNGNMVALVLKERRQVDALHAKALALGGTDEGAPGGAWARGAAGILRRLFPRSGWQQGVCFSDRTGELSLPRLWFANSGGRG